MEHGQRASRRHILFSRIRQLGPIARIDLAEATDISQPTVTTITAELLKSGLIEEVTPEEPAGDTRRGRPRVALRVKGSAHRVVGLKLSDYSLSGVLTDFENTVLAETEILIDADAIDHQKLIDLIEATTQNLTAQAGLSVSDLSGVGFGLPGVVDAQEGIITWSPLLSGRDIDLRAMLQDRLNVPFFVDNDANLVAVAEQNYGAGKTVRNFLVVTIEHGVGLGIVLDNKVHQGARGYAAEFGHINVQLGGALCRCGKRGCLEAYVADYALLREGSLLEGVKPGATKQERLGALLMAARRGNEIAKSVVDRAEKYFAIGLANLITLFDPELIVISGERMKHDYLVAEDVIASIKEHLHPQDTIAPEIRIHKWGDMMWARGAAAYAIDGVSDAAIRRIESCA